ncbi:MAG TPA: serine/threonine-protein kinase [Planctomycetota bacterium]|nr:serine/threonine-protein kinase [Planctomycetota bacterium]
MGSPGRLGDFELGEEIGRGGFGIVYRARQVSLDRPVAVKVLFRHLVHTDDQLSRFEREARAAARLDHPAIVSVYAWGQSGEDFFIAQRLVGRGRTLADELNELRSAGPPPKGHFRQVAERFESVAHALQQAHDRGVVHRDVKPSNILLDEEGRPCLTDFGLAKVEDGLELSRTGDFAGSPYYMSPEQADSRRGGIDHRSDVYSLGVTLFESLTLTQPFQGNGAHEVIRRILTEEPRRPGRIESRVPPDLETICLHAMEKDPARRYATARDFAEDLRAYLDGEPIAAVPISSTRRALRVMRRHYQPIALGVLLFVLVVGGLWAGEALMKSREDDSRDKFAVVGQTTLNDELGRINEDFMRKIQDAAQQQDVETVQQLAAEQQELTHKLKENYDWMAGQLEGFGDKDALAQVGGGLATGGVVGGLESFGQVLLGRKAAAGGDTLKSEVERRLDELSAIFGRSAAGAQRETTEVLIDGSKYMLMSALGRLYAIPLEPGSEASAGEGEAEGATEGAAADRPQVAPAPRPGSGSP